MERLRPIEAPRSVFTSPTRRDNEEGTPAGHTRCALIFAVRRLGRLGSRSEPATTRKTRRGFRTAYDSTVSRSCPKRLVCQIAIATASLITRSSPRARALPSPASPYAGLRSRRGCHTLFEIPFGLSIRPLLFLSRFFFVISLTLHTELVSPATGLPANLSPLSHPGSGLFLLNGLPSTAHW